MQRKNGFTLIELLVVISIIALLIGILLPALGAARSTARNLACLSNTRQMGIALATYHTENDGYFMPTFVSGETDFFRLISEQIEGGDFSYASVTPQDVVFTNVLRCPEAAVPNQDNTANYAANIMIMPVVVGNTPIGDLTWLKIDSLRNASEMAGIMDSSQAARDVNDFGQGLIPEGHTFAGLDKIDADTGKDSNDYLSNKPAGYLPDDPIDLLDGANADAPSAKNARFRHQGDTGLNVSWIDGHGSSQKTDTLLKKNIHPKTPRG